MKQSRMISLRLIAISCLIIAIVELFASDTANIYFTTTLILMASGLEAVRFELVRIHTWLHDDKESNNAPGTYFRKSNTTS